ncbi:MAG: U32 family peptidase [Firmicutes bacterium]|nr:U32 family peptidase [Bacillota bacterium]MBR0522297.1 U32 family peptidase [Bacillota bacterium]
MTDLRNIELLAPAGDMEGIQTAVRYGADAVYCGGPFMQLRASKVGFSEEDLWNAASHVHAFGKKIYTTVNCFANNDEIPLLGDYAQRLYDIGIDAIIVSDIGAIAEIKEKCPDMEIHLSTQANCMNYRAAGVYYNMGVARIVLARELSIEKIAELSAKAPRGLELEAFIHGAMCMSYSGRCLLSAYLAGRSGNRGECAQSCRWNYYLMEEKRPGEYYQVIEDEKGSGILSSKELCCVDILDMLAEAGISSFKIEGRMRTPYSIGTTVNAYRMAMDGTAGLEDIHKELDTSSHRPWCTGFYLGDPESIAPDTQGYIRDWLFIGSAAADEAGGSVKLLTRNPFKVGDTLEVVSPGMPGRPFIVTSIVTEDGESIQRSASPMKTMTINCPAGVTAGDLFRRLND